VVARNPPTLADVMFEDFLNQEGYDRYTFEPDWSEVVGRPISTCPDYLLEIDGLKIACEIKGFEPSDKRDKIWDWSKGSFWVGQDDELAPIRQRLKDGAKSLKPLAGTGMPLVIVLANPPRPDLRRTNVDLDAFNLVSAMYGNTAVVASLEPDGPVTQVVTRGGRMARQHQYVSVVVTLSRIAPTGPVFADMYDTPGEEAVPLPDAVFEPGLRTRYGFRNDNGDCGIRFYGRVFR
jgi:hypothetical protein